MKEVSEVSWSGSSFLNKFPSTLENFSFKGFESKLFSEDLLLVKCIKFAFLL